MRNCFFSVFISFCLCACSTSPEILRIRSLGPHSHSQKSKESDGYIEGLERSSLINGQISANILFVHGIGWTQDKNKTNFAFDFVQAIEYFYKKYNITREIKRICPQSTFDIAPSKEKKQVSVIYKEGGIRIVSEIWPYGLATDDPKAFLFSTDAACMDKITVKVENKGRFNIYRVIVDDELYNAYQYPQLGYDDLGVNTDEAGYENLAITRSPQNRKLKDALVTYGLSDAAMYMGPVGQIMRDTVNGAICAAIRDASDETNYFENNNGKRKTVDELCEDNPLGSKTVLSIFSESLGSRVIFDVLTGDTDPRILKKLKSLENTEIEVFLLANQIPLIGLSRLRQNSRPESQRVRFVAISEINDVLSYELVPYFEHLYNLRCRNAGVMPPPVPAECISTDINTRQKQFSENEKIRQQLIEDLGFDVVDVRMQFASPFLGIYTPLKDPLEAHTGYLKINLVQQLIFCGVDSGKVRGDLSKCP